MTDSFKNENGRFIAPGEIDSVELSRTDSEGSFRYLFDAAHFNAINTAIACQRPLLLTGDPGVGKTQLARAAASALGRALVRYTVDAKTEARDLLWQFDAVARLADAQIAKSSGWDEKKLDIHNYLRPGPLWWAFNWQQAKGQYKAKALEPFQHDKGDPDKGVVVLLDEIDKAEIDVPNGLLEALGDASFHPDGLAKAVTVKGVYPLIVITTNRERSLPDAFVRRCVVMKMALPTDDDALRELLVKRGEAHTGLPRAIREQAADQFIKDRKQAKSDKMRYLPGQAEYIDLLRVIEELNASGFSSEKLLEMASPYILRKGDAL